jgi:hypothetical protein
MYRAILSVLTAIILGIVVVTLFFLLFNVQSAVEIIPELTNLFSNGAYWVGVGVFSILFFALFTLPLTLMTIKVA